MPTVPGRIEDKILRGEFIYCYDSMFATASEGSASKAILISLTPDSLSEGGNVIVAQPRQQCKKTISDLTSWLEAWNTYVPVLINDQPRLGPCLVAYQRIICSANKVSLPQQWLDYDESFRTLVSTEPTTLWHKRHEDLWLECMEWYQTVVPVRHTQSSRVPCTYCNSITHFPENCFQNPFHRQPRGGTVSKEGSAIPHSQFHSTNSTLTVHRQPRLGSPQSFPPICKLYNRGCAQGRIADTNRNSCSVHPSFRCPSGQHIRIRKISYILTAASI